MYATTEQARARGATGTDEEVTVALLAAGERIDRYTGQRFEPAVATEVLRVLPDGVTCPLPMPVSAVTEVRADVDDPDVPVLATAAWTVTSDAVLIRYGYGSDVLVAGAEPWSGGWANLYGRLRAVRVTGTWGWAEVPPVVAEAAAILSTLLAPGTFTPQANAEGDAIGVPPGAVTADQLRVPQQETVGPWGTDRGNAGRAEDTTGLAYVDRLLATYRNRYRVG